jgi:hypothetical protein
MGATTPQSNTPSYPFPNQSSSSQPQNQQMTDTHQQMLQQAWKELRPDIAALLQTEIERATASAKAQAFNNAPLLNGTFKRVLVLVAIGVSFVLLWEGGKYVFSHFFTDAGEMKAKK